MMIYFDNNTTSYPKPKSVISAVNNSLTNIPQSAYRSSYNGQSIVENCRNKVAAFFNVDDANRVIFTSGSTEALNLAIFGLKKPGHIITSVTEHNSVIRPLKTLERDAMVELTFVGCDSQGFISPNDIKKCIKKNTSAIIINHCSNVTGAIQDLNAISEIASNNNIPFIVDASQSAGAIDINLKQTPVDLLVFTGHKSLFGIPGAGGFVINPELKLKPLKVGGTGIRSSYLYQPETLPYLYESGTYNSVGLAALYAGIEYINQIGISNIHNKKIEIFNYIINHLKDYNEISFYGGLSLENKLPVLNIRLKNLSVSDFGYMLNESFKIAVRYGLHCAPLIHKAIGSYPEGSIRLSFSHNNTIEEAEFFVNIVKKVIKESAYN